MTVLLLAVVACSNDRAADTAKTDDSTNDVKASAKQSAEPKPLIANFDTPQAVYDAVERAKVDGDVERGLSLMTEEGWAATIPSTLYAISFVGQHMGKGVRRWRQKEEEGRGIGGSCYYGRHGHCEGRDSALASRDLV